MALCAAFRALGPIVRGSSAFSGMTASKGVSLGKETRLGDKARIVASSLTAAVTGKPIS